MKVRALIVLAAIVAVIGVGILVLQMAEKKPSFVVYVPSYFLYGMDERDKEAAYSYVFYQWGEEHGVNVTVRWFDSEAAMIETIKQEVESGKVEACVAIMTLSSFWTIEDWSKYFVRYKPEKSSLIDERLINVSQTDWYATPFEWMPLTFVYDSRYVKLEKTNFTTFLENKTLASYLMFVDPSVTEPGPHWLLSLIAYYRITGGDWKTWVSELKDYINITGTWYQAWTILTSEEKDKYIMTGYLSDAPLSNLWFYTNVYRFDAIYINGTYYAWYEIGVIAIVKNNPYPELSKEFVEWFLTEPVQRWLPLYNGFLPANKYVFDEVPVAFTKYGPDFAEIEPLNTVFTREEILQNLSTWIEEWVELVSS